MTSFASSPALSNRISGRVAPPQRDPYVVGVLDGEGSGPEVVSAALRVLDALALPVQIERGGLIGLPAEQVHGRALSEDVIAFSRSIFSNGGALFHGAGGGRFVYELRREFDLFCKIAAVRPFPELQGISRFRPSHLDGVDIVMVRENSGGVYQGIWRDTVAADGERVAEHAFSYAQTQVQRIMDVAARIAMQRRGEITVVIKDGGMPSVSALWRDCATQLSGVNTRVINVDFAAFELVHNPRAFDVLVTTNLFGDILVDLSGALVGSRALACSGNFSHTAAVYQTNHGAAHDLAGHDLANPVGQILALAMMLRESFGLFAEADRVERAIRAVWRDGWRTADIAEAGCRTIGTREIANRIADAVSAGE